jgi:hypothetical protein
MAELLLKKEFDLSVLATFDVEKSIDDLEDTTDEDRMGKPAEDSISIESLEPIELKKSAEPIEPMEPKESIEPIEPMEPIDDIDDIVDIEDLKAIEAIKPTRTIKAKEPMEPIEPTKPIEDIKYSEPMEPIEPTKPIEDIKYSEPMEPIEPIKPIEDIEFSEPVEPIEPVESSEPAEPIEPVESSEPAEPIEDIEDIEHMEPIDRGKPEESSTEQDESYVSAREDEKSAEEVLIDDLEGLDNTPPGDDEKAAAPIIPLDAAPEEKKRLKFFNVTLILIFLILVIGGIILLLLPMMESTDQKENVVEKAGEKSKKDIIEIEEKVPPGKKGTTGPGEKTGEKKSEISGTDQTPPTTSLTPGKTAKAYFLEGSFVTAGDVWKREIIKAGVKYGILLELDCLKESVMNAYNKLPAKKDFYILNRRMGSKTCFLVVWGKFYTHEQATEAIKSPSIPNYFWQQKDPPQIIQLSRYL